MRKLKLLFAACALWLGAGTQAQTWTGNEPAEGTFLIYNVGADKFINNGDPSESWGTNAYLQAGFGLDFTLVANSDAYRLDSKLTNGQKHFLASDLWCDGAAADFIFAAVDGQEKTYTIQNGNYYLIANDDLNDVVNGSLTNDNKSWWKLVSLDDFKAAMQAKPYSATDPMDVSVFIQGRSFARNDGNRTNAWVTTHNGGNWTWIGGSDNKYYGNESWNNTFSVSQELTDLPDGTYEVQCSGFGTNGTTYIFGNSTSKAIQTDNTTSYGASKEAKWKAIHEDNAFAGQSTGKFTLSGGTLNLGIKRETNSGGDWAVWDEFRLYYYGLDLSEFAATLADAVAAAEAVEGTIPAAAYNDLKAFVDEKNKTYTSAAEYTSAANAIIEATNTAKDLQANYTRYKNVKDAIKNINSGIDLTDADTQVEAATSDEGINAAVATARAALAIYLSTVTLGQGETIDLTDALIDNAAPGISGSTAYWVNSVTPGLENKLYEFWNQPGATTMQIITTSLPAGNYKLTAVAFTRTNYNAKLSAGAASTNIATVSSSSVNNRLSGSQWIAEGNGNGVNNLIFNLPEATSNLQIGLTADNENGDHWMCWRSFRLVYGDVFESYELVSDKMNAEVASAQTDADNAFKSNPTPETYMAVIEAIAAAQASAEAYKHLTSVVEKVQYVYNLAISTEGNKVTATQEEINKLQALYLGYMNGTIADNDVMAKVKEGYDLLIPIIKTQTATENVDFTLAIRNYSFEYGDVTGWTVGESADTGVRDVSNEIYSTTGSDGYYLFNTWWQGIPLKQTIENIPNGQYTLTAMVASDNGATIYLIANDEHNDGTIIDNDKTVGVDATFTFLVKNGTVTIGVVGGAEDGSYIDDGHWWYKADNFRLVKNRDLTPKESLVVPTAIALYNGETEVTEPIALTATANTVTLTPSYTPANATEGYLTWESSDETVATVVDGVVTAVSTGTATITATSTVAPEVKAVATVNVTFPETNYALTGYTNDGATRTNYTLGDNLIKNGAFEYPNTFYGWTVGTGAAMSADNFDLVTEEDNHYIKAKGHTGADGVNSISTGWAIESGKSYVFGYKVKSTSAGNSEFHVVSLTNTLGVETSKVSENSTAVGTDWTDVKYTFTNTDGYAYVQFRARWLNSAVSFDDFYLAEATTTTVGNVDYATAAIPTANIGDGVFQYSQAAIDAANALVQGTATVADVEAAYVALTTLNAPDADKRYALTILDEGKDWSGNAVTFIAGAREGQGGYGIKYLAPQNQNLAQALLLTKTTGNKYKLSIKKADGTEQYMTTALLGYSTGANEQIRTTDDASKALEVEVRATTTDGQFKLWNTAANKEIANNDNNDVYTNRSANFTIAEAPQASITINTTAAGWGTIILPFAVSELPTGVKAYTCAEVNEKDQLTLVEVDALEANIPYIIEGGWNETLTGDAQGAALKYEYDEYLLTGVYTATLAPAGSYVLQNLNNKVGFYVVGEGEGNQPLVGANRAYLELSAPSSTRAFILSGVTTGIDAIKALTNGEATIYNTNGVQIPQLQKGMNIIKTNDGRTIKVMVK